MRPITLVYSYCSQEHMLAHQYATWAAYPDEAKAGVSIIIVDDCSRETPAIAVPRPVGLPPLEIYRVGIWKDWGWPMARNLGMHHAPEGVCLLTDLDHVLSADEVVKLAGMDVADGVAYRPTRQKPNGESYKPHNDTFALTRKTFWKTGGYSLKYLGWYGTSSIFSRRLHMLADVHITDTFKLTVFNLGGEDIGGIAGAGTTGMGRKGSDHHVSRSPFAHETKTAHLTAPVGVLDFPWERQL
jgi:hypothetical protein